MATQPIDDEWEYSQAPASAGPAPVAPSTDDEWEYSAPAGATTTATNPYGKMGADEEALFAPDPLRIKPERLPKDVEDAYYGMIAQNKGRPDFGQKTIDDFFTTRGYAAMAADDKFIEAVRKGEDTGKIDYSPWDEAQLKLEDDRMKQAMEDFSKQAYEGDYASAVDEGAQYGFWGITSRTLKDVFDTNKDALREQYPNASEEELERLSDQDVIRRARAARNYYSEANKDSGWAPWLAGQFTSAIDPTMFIAPGVTAPGRVAGQGGAQMVTQGVFEGIDAAQGLPSGQAGENILMAGGLGVATQGLFELGGKLYQRARGPQGEEIVEEVVNPTPEQIQSVARGVEGEEGLPGPMGMEGEAGIPGPRFTPKPEAAAPEVTPPKVTADQARESIDYIISDWTNAPEIEIVQSARDLGDDSIDPDALGFLGEDGKVRIIADNLEGPEDVRAVLFHEALGHHGLAQKFGEDLDDMFMRAYDSGGKFKEDVDQFIKDRPDYVEAYADDVNPTARLIEEIFAGKSESGIVLPPNILAKMKVYLKDMARKMGITKWTEMTDKDIQTILGMAHAATISGKPNAVANGFKYAKVFHGSGADFDAFDHSKMGSGEGAQVFGWGTYLTDSEGIARSYRNKLGEVNRTWGGMEQDYYQVRRNAQDYGQMRYGEEGVRDVVDPYFHYMDSNNNNKPESAKDLFNWHIGEHWDNMGADYQKEFTDIFNDIDSKVGVNRKGKMYEVEIPDDGVWIDWNFQPTDKVKEVFEELGVKAPEMTLEETRTLQTRLRELEEKLSSIYDLREEVYRESLELKTTLKTLTDPQERAPLLKQVMKLNDEYGEMDREWMKVQTEYDGINRLIWSSMPTGEDLYKQLADKMGPEKASKALAAKGITGNRYAANSLSGDPDFDTFNYVVFDDKTPKITKKFMKRQAGKGSEGSLQGSATREVKERGDLNTPISKFRSTRDLSQITEEIMPERTKESWDEWIDEAGSIKMSAKAAENLATGVDVPHLKAAEMLLLRTKNRIFDLSRKAGNQTLSPREMESLRVEMNRAKNIAQSIQDVVSNAARILNSRNIEVSDDRALSANIRNMLRKIDEGKLDDPVELQKMADALRKGDKKDKAIAESLNILTEILNLPRSIMSSMDLSAPLRQGIFLIGNKRFWGALMPMIKQFAKEKNYDFFLNDIKSRPTFPAMMKGGLAIMSKEGKRLDKREEAFLGTWAEKIPVLGRGVKASNRAYTGFLNKLRADVFDDLVRKYHAAGIDVTGKGNEKALKDIVKFINAATGRGSLGNFDQAAAELSNAFFSPRLLSARVTMLNPATYVKLDPIVRREALKSLVSFAGIAGTVASLAAMMFPDDVTVETDPRSSDFMKIKVGNTRYDILGGFGQYITLGSRIITNSKKNAKGEIKELGKDYGSDNALDVIARFFGNKEAPLASLLTDYLRGENAVGEEFSWDTAIISRMVPMMWQDMAELVSDRGAVGIPMAIPAVFGVGSQTYNVELGFDAFGRDIAELQKKDEPETDPVILQVSALGERTGENPLAKGPKSFKFEGQKYELTDEQAAEWQKIMGDLQHQFLSEDILSDEWVMGDDNDKLKITKKAHDDAFAQTKEHFLTNVFSVPPVNQEEEVVEDDDFIYE